MPPSEYQKLQSNYFNTLDLVEKIPKNLHLSCGARLFLLSTNLPIVLLRCKSIEAVAKLVDRCGSYCRTNLLGGIQVLAGDALRCCDHHSRKGVRPCPNDLLPSDDLVPLEMQRGCVNQMHRLCLVVTTALDVEIAAPADCQGLARVREECAVDH